MATYCQPDYPYDSINVNYLEWTASDGSAYVFKYTQVCADGLRARRVDGVPVTPPAVPLASSVPALGLHTQTHIQRETNCLDKKQMITMIPLPVPVHALVVSDRLCE